MLHGRILSDNEIACYASHFALWEECARLDEPILVLEDDVRFCEHFLDAIAEIHASSLPFVRLYYLDKKRERFVKRIGDTHYHWSLKNTNGTQGYYLTPRAARAFLRFGMWDSPVDVQMEFVARHKIDNIIYKPFPIAESADAATTTIASRFSAPASVGFCLRLLRPFYRAVVQLKRAVFKLFYRPPEIK